MQSENKGKFERGRGPAPSQDKYNDSQEAKDQMEKIRKIEADMKAVQQQLTALHSKGKEVERKVKLTLKDKSKAEARIEGLVTRINKLKSEHSDLQIGLKAHLDLVETRRVTEAKAKNGLLRQRKKNQSDEEFVSSCLGAIDARVAELNHELESHAGSVSEERRILKEQQRVRATKTQIPVYLQRSRQFQEARTALKRAERDIESKHSFIATLESELEELRSEIAALDGKETAEQAPKEALSSEEEILTDRLNGLYADLRATKDGLNENREKWYESRREKARAKAEAAQQKREEEYQRREAERREMAEEAREKRRAAVPYAREMADCQMLLVYLDGLNAPKAASEGNANKEPKEKKPVAAESAEKKDDPLNINKKGHVASEEDDWGSFATQKKKGRKNKNKQAPKFSINLQSMDQFAKLGFSAPLSLEEVPALREEVQTKADALTKKSAEEHASTLAAVAAEEEEERLADQKRAAAAQPAKEENAATPAAQESAEAAKE